jgi:hypothetical protein
MYEHIFRAGHAFSRAHKAATRAACRGDLAGADKWLKLAERHERLAIRLYKLLDTQLDFDVMEERALAERKRIRRQRRDIRAAADARMAAQSSPASRMGARESAESPIAVAHVPPESAP